MVEVWGGDITGGQIKEKRRGGGCKWEKMKQLLGEEVNAVALDIFFGDKNPGSG